VRVGLVGAGCAAALALAAGPASAADDRFVYVSSGAFSGNAAQYIAAFEIGGNGSLSAVPGSPYPSGGTVTEGIAMTPDAENVYVALFGTSQVGAFNVNANGSLSAVGGSPFGTGFATPLSVQVDPDGGHLFATNHGANRAIAVSTINASGSLTNIGGSPFTMPVGRNDPFASSVSPDGDHYYSPSENNNPASAPEVVVAWNVAANGAVSFLQAIGSGTLANQANPFGSAITPDGQFLFVSNPEDGANGTVSSFRVNANGTLTPVVQALNVAPGNHPLNMAVSPDGTHLYVASRASNSVNAYNINGNGTLSAIAGQPFATGGTNGKGLAITPDGKYLYVSNNMSDNVSRFAVLPTGGLALQGQTPLPNTADGIDSDLESIVITPNQGPTAALTTTPGFAGQPTGFDATGSTDPDGDVARYDWDFGDGTTLPDGGPVPNHIYSNPGTYNVQVTVTDDENCSDQRIFTGKAMLCNATAAGTASQSVTVAEAPPDAPTNFARTVSIKYKDDKFKGKVKSDAAGCINGQKVKVFRKESGPDPKVAKGTSKADGKWSAKEKNADGKYYAKVAQTRLADDDVCLAAQSKKTKIG
jgi:6-phosphogluconolactonase (cycloisomerase 2 family)